MMRSAAHLRRSSVLPQRIRAPSAISSRPISLRASLLFVRPSSSACSHPIAPVPLLQHTPVAQCMPRSTPLCPSRFLPHRQYASSSFNYDAIIQQIPNPRKMTGERGDFGWVSDTAGIVESRDQQTIDEAINNVYKMHGAEIAVVTLQALPTKNSEEYRAFATRLFNSWGIGNAARDIGVLILLIKDNRRFEVVTGTGLATVVPSAWLSEFQENELERPLKSGDYSRALTMTALAIAEKIDDHERQWRRSQPKPKEVEKKGSGVMEALGQLALLVGLIAAWVLYKWQQEDKLDPTHKCSFCGGEVKRDLSRILSYTDAQAKEVALGAVTYEVGSCKGCRRTQNIRHPALRKGDVHKCGYCHYYTAQESVSYIVDDKAQKRTKLTRLDCSNCGVRSFKQEPVAYTTTTDSDSSSSSWSSDSGSSSGFGGGSSSGGGAGRSF